jgi:hypothetical protein
MKFFGKEISLRQEKDKLNSAGGPQFIIMFSQPEVKVINFFEELLSAPISAE